MPREIKTFLSSGFPRGFVGGKYGLGVVANEYRSKEPNVWYAQLWQSSEQKLKCDFARDYPFNCFLFNVMAREYINLLRFSLSGYRHLAPDPKDLTINFIFQYCRMRYQTLGRNSLDYDPRGYCPNPCFNKTIYCESMENTKDGECEIDVENPFREDGFKCICKKDYIWSVSSKFCISNSSSFKSFDIECSRNGTEAIINSVDHGFVCQCKKNFYGKKCEQIINACKGSVSNKVSGNAACRVSKGNLCLSSEMHLLTEDPFYQCQCTDNYRRNTSFPQDNCLYEYKACEKWICLHGVCVSTNIDTEALCICKKGWSGDHCDILMIKEGVTPWNQWSICEPICGETRLRQRERFCLSRYCDEDVFEEIRPCRSRSCFRYHHPDSRDKYIMDVQLADDSRPEIDYFTLGMVLAVIAHVLLAAIFIQWRLFGPFLQLVGTHKAGMNKERDTSLKLPGEESSGIQA